MKRMIITLVLTVALLVNTVIPMATAEETDVTQPNEANYMISVYQDTPIREDRTIVVYVATSAGRVDSLDLKLGFNKTKYEFLGSDPMGYLKDFEMHSIELSRNPVTDDPEIGEIWIKGYSLELRGCPEKTVIAALTFKVLEGAGPSFRMFPVDTLQFGSFEPDFEYHGYSERIKGDLNGDGVISLNDAVRLFYYLNGRIALSKTEVEAADVNDDGVIDVEDVLAILCAD